MSDTNKPEPGSDAPKDDRNETDATEQQADRIEDAEIVPEPEAAQEPDDKTESTEGETAESEAIVAPEPEAAAIDDAPPAPSEDSDAPAGLAAAAGAATGAAAAATLAAKPEREVVRETVVEKRGGIVPGLIGGVIGGVAVLFGLPYVLPPNMLPPANTDALETRVAAVETAAAELPALQSALSERAAAADLAALSERAESLAGQVDTLATGLGDLTAATTANVEGIQSAVADVSTDLAGVAGTLEALGPRILDLEKRPIAESPDPTAVSAVRAYGEEVQRMRETYDAAVAALRAQYEADVAALTEQVSGQMDRSEEVLQEAILRASEARAEAERLAAEAAERARITALQAALVDVQAAIEAGQPYADALARLDGEAIPEGLTAAAASGVATFEALQESFPAAAREALAVSREKWVFLRM